MPCHAVGRDHIRMPDDVLRPVAVDSVVRGPTAAIVSLGLEGVPKPPRILALRTHSPALQRDTSAVPVEGAELPMHNEKC